MKKSTRQCGCVSVYPKMLHSKRESRLSSCRPKSMIALSIMVLLSLFTGNSLHAQTLNQTAVWPTTNWTLTGTYNSTALLANPTATSSNWSYDDDGAGSGSTDIMYLESPVINLSSAFNAGETWISISFDYNYNYGDIFKLEYWDSDAAAWVLISDIPDNSSSSSNYCTSTSYVNWTSDTLDIGTFTSTKLSGFKYRFKYDASAVFGWGFCVGPPTIKSILPPSCIDPSFPMVLNVTSNTADLSWTASTSGPQGYDWVFMAAGAAPDIATAVSSGYTTTTTGSGTGLAVNTQYDAYVRADCGGSSSNWVAAPSFFTACPSITTLPFIEDFESVTSPSTPSCWTVLDVNGDGDKWITTNDASYAKSGTKSASIYTDYNAGANNDYLILPPITLNGNQQLRYSVRARSVWEPNDMMILLSTSGTNPTSFTDTLQPLMTVGYITYADSLIDLSSYTGNVNIAFYVKPGGLDGWYLFLDDIIVEDIPLCGPPTVISTSGITSSTTNISWNAPTIIPSGYDWVVMASGAAPDIATAISTGSSTTTSAMASSLVPSTTYDIYVRSDCGGGLFSPWTGPTSFTTGCGPVTLYPHIQDFSTFTPTCWTMGGGGSAATGPATLGSSDWVSDGFLNNGYTGAARINIFSSNDRDWLISPQFTLPASPSFGLSYDIGAVDYGNTSLTDPWESDDSVLVLISTNASTWTQLWSYNDLNTPSGTGQYDYVDLSAYAGQTVQIAFVSIEGPLDGPSDIDISIDNFKIDVLPTCFTPLSLSASNVTAMSANLAWSAPNLGNPPSAYNYIVVAAGAGPTGTPVAQGNTSSLTANATGLSQNTTYDLYVQSDCSGSSSAWAGPKSFTTPCNATPSPYTYDVESATATTSAANIADCWSSSPSSGYQWNITGTGNTLSSGTGPNTASSGSKFFFTEASNGGTGDSAFLKSPFIDLSSLTIPYLIYSYHMYGTDLNKLYTQIWDGAAFVTVDSLVGQQQITGSLPWQTAGIDISAVASTTTQIRFVGIRGGGIAGDISIDDIAIIDAPICINPSAVTATFDPVASSAEISWIPPQGAPPSQYNYLVVKADSGYASPNIVAGGSSPSSPVTVAGLQYSTNYDIFVQSNCGAGGTSYWSGPYTLKIPCIENLPYFQDFESTTNCQPTCWQKESTNGDYFTFCVAPQITCNGTKGMRLDPNTFFPPLANDDWVFSPFFNLTAGTSYRIKFSYKNDNTTKRQKLDMYVGDAQVGTSQTTILFKDDSITSATCQNVVIDYTPTTSGLATFGFHAYGAASQGNIGFDDFSVDLTPAMNLWSVADNSNDDACSDSTIYGVAGNAWHELYDATGKIVLSINPNGNYLGRVDVNYIDQSAPETWSAVGAGSAQFKTVPRRFAITPQHQPTTPVDVRFYYQGAELDTFNNANVGTGPTTYGVPALYFTKHEVTAPDCILTNNTGQASLLNFIDAPVGAPPVTGSPDFYVEAVVPSFSEFTLHEPTTSIGPLNISFKNFTGHIVDNTIQLSWNLLDADQGNKVEIEKLHNGIWRTIGTLDVNATEAYNFIDHEVAALNTYRLSYLGKKSEVLSIKDVSGTIVTIYPNPADDFIKVEIDNTSADELTLSIYDVVGRKMIAQKMTTTRNAASEEIHIGNLPAGSYLIKIEDSHSVLYNSALIVK